MMKNKWAILLGVFVLFLATCLLAGVIASVFTEQAYAVMWFGTYRFTSKGLLGKMLFSILGLLLGVVGIRILYKVR